MTAVTLLPAGAASRWSANPPTLGVEEEFALLDPASGKVVPAAAEVIRACADPGGVVAEFMRYMVETRTPVCETLDDVSQALAARRARAAAEARRRGTRLVVRAWRRSACPIRRQ